MRGIKGINKVLNSFLKEYECMARLGTEFCYLHHSSLIYYTFVVTDKGEEEFMESVNRLNPKVSMDIFLWSFLHELGHHETIDDLTEEEYNQCEIAKADIEEGILPTSEYYDLLDERLATEWAVEFANTHTEELRAFWNILKEKILNFYKLNEISVDNE